MIRVLICDDQDVVCDGLNAILSTDLELNVVGMAANGVEALESLAHARPDVVLMDLKMPIMNGVQATRRIRQQYPDVKVLVLTTYDADEWVFDAIRSGACGYLLKDTPRPALIAAVKNVAWGKTPVDPAVAGKLFAQIAEAGPRPDTALAEALSDREKDVLGWLARGLSNAEIAARLYLSEGTVRNYVSAIFSKLDVADRTQAAVLAIRCGLAARDEA